MISCISLKDIRRQNSRKTINHLNRHDHCNQSAVCYVFVVHLASFSGEYALKRAIFWPILKLAARTGIEPVFQP